MDALRWRSSSAVLSRGSTREIRNDANEDTSGWLREETGEQVGVCVAHLPKPCFRSHLSSCSLYTASAFSDASMQQIAGTDGCGAGGDGGSVRSPTLLPATTSLASREECNPDGSNRDLLELRLPRAMPAA